MKDTGRETASAVESKGAFYTNCTDCHSSIHGTDIPLQQEAREAYTMKKILILLFSVLFIFNSSVFAEETETTETEAEIYPFP